MDLLKKGTIFAFALSAVSTAVWANGAAGVTGQDASAQARIGGEVSFQEADLDDSGFVDATEAKELELDIVEHDVNHDGLIDRTEWERAPEQASEAGAAGQAGAEMGESGAMQSAADMTDLTFEEADLDDSGFVDATEAKELDLDVVRFDMNYNGIIDPVEWARAPAEATDPGAASAQQSAADSEAQESGRVMRAPAEMVGLSFKEADLDDSGFVDAVEAGELGLDVVRFDVNYNGIIDRVEWERAPGEARDPGKNRESQ